MRRALTTSLLIVLAACGGENETPTAPSPPPAAVGDEEPPALRETSYGYGRTGSAAAKEASMGDGAIAGIPLPELPVSEEQASEPLRDGWSRAHAALTLDPPRLPDDLHPDEYGRWLQDTWIAWFARKWERVEAATERLDAIATRGDEEAPVAAALIGVMAAQALEQVLAVPLPPSLEAREDVRRAVRETLLPRARPIVSLLRDAFLRCERVAATAMTEWRRFCEGHRRTSEERYERAREGDHGRP